MVKIILGSSSLPRLHLLKKIGCTPDEISVPDIDETPLKKEKPGDLAMRLAIEKAKKIHPLFPNDIVISADTVCATGRLALPKALNEDDVRFCLEKISGKRHRVYTGVCGIRGDKIIKKLGMTIISFKRLTEKEINEYVADKKQWFGNAGGYTLRGSAAAFVTMTSGDEISSVIGLPLYHTKNMIMTLGGKISNNTEIDE